MIKIALLLFASTIQSKIVTIDLSSKQNKSKKQKKVQLATTTTPADATGTIQTDSTSVFYYTAALVGSNDQQAQFGFDITTQTTWLESTACLSACSWISGTGYDPLTSSSCMVDITQESQQYNGNTLTGYYEMDSISLSSYKLNATNMTFLSVLSTTPVAPYKTSETATTGTQVPFSGVIGLGFGNPTKQVQPSFIANLVTSKQLANNVVGFVLNNQATDSKATSNIVLGGLDATLSSGLTFSTCPIDDTTSNYWNMALTSLTVDSQAAGAKVATSTEITGQTATKPLQGLYLNSSSSLIYVPSYVLSQISTALTSVKIANTITNGVLSCTDISSIKSITFTFCAGKTWSIPAASLFTQQADKSYACSLQANLQDSTNNYVILGLPFFYGQYVNLDLGAKTISYSVQAVPKTSLIKKVRQQKKKIVKQTFQTLFKDTEDFNWPWTTSNATSTTIGGEVFYNCIDQLPTVIGSNLNSLAIFTSFLILLVTLLA